MVVKHTHLFPRGLAEIIGRHSVEELHITLTEGLWNYDKYGYPFNSAGPGAEIYAWFNKNVTKYASTISNSYSQRILILL